MAEKPVVAPASFELELELPAPRSAPSNASAAPLVAARDALESFDEIDHAASLPLDLAPAPSSAPIAQSVAPSSAPVSRIRPLPLDVVAPSRPFVSPVAPASRIEPPPSQLRELSAKIRLPIRLIVGAIGITVVDLLVTRVSGDVLMIGPVRPAWIAGPLALVGVALAFWRIFGARDDE